MQDRTPSSEPAGVELPEARLFERPEPPLPHLAEREGTAPQQSEGVTPLPSRTLPLPPLPARDGGSHERPLPRLEPLALPVSTPPAPSPALETPAAEAPQLRPALTPRHEPPLPQVSSFLSGKLPSLPYKTDDSPLPPLAGGPPEAPAGNLPGREPAEGGTGSAVALLTEIAEGIRKLARPQSSEKPAAPALGPSYVPFPGLGGGMQDGFAVASPSLDVSRLSGLRGAGGYGYGTYAGPDTRANYLEPLANRLR